MNGEGRNFLHFGHLIVKNCGPRRIENLCLKSVAFSEVMDAQIESEQNRADLRNRRTVLSKVGGAPRRHGSDLDVCEGLVVENGADGAIWGQMWQRVHNHITHTLVLRLLARVSRRQRVLLLRAHVHGEGHAGAGGAGGGGVVFREEGEVDGDDDHELRRADGGECGQSLDGGVATVCS